MPVSEHRTTERRVKERRKRTSHGGSRQDSTPARDGGEYAQRLAPMRSPLYGTSHLLPRSHSLMRSVPRPHALPGWQRLTTHSSVVDGGPRAPPQSTGRTHTLPGRQKAPTRSPPRPATPSTARYVRTYTPTCGTCPRAPRRAVRRCHGGCCDDGCASGAWRWTWWQSVMVADCGTGAPHLVGGLPPSETVVSSPWGGPPPRFGDRRFGIFYGPSPVSK